MGYIHEYEQGEARVSQGSNTMRISERNMCKMIAFSGLLILIIGALAVIDLLAYAGASGLSTWGDGARMAIPTGICFMLTGSALILIAGIHKK